ncbi:MAG: hypothetical protein ABUL63_01495, partial [Acidobacteriota bacterium]
MYRIEADASREQAFASILYELGSDFLFVDGACHYWVMAPSSRSALEGDPLDAWRPYHEGTLSGDQEQRVHDLLGYDDVLIEGPRCIPSSAVDASPTTIWDGSATYVCQGNLKD